MSNVAPERMPDVIPMPKAEPVEAQDIKAAEEAYARADAEEDLGKKHVNKNQAYPDGMIPGYEPLTPRRASAPTKAKPATHKQPVKRSAKHK